MKHFHTTKPVTRVLLIGGAGFIGQAIAAEATRHGIACLVPTRRRSRARALLPLPTVEVVERSLSQESLDELVAQCDAVVNLVGILHGRAGRAGDPFGPDFEYAHVTLPRMIGTACEKAGVRRLIQVSALGVKLDADAPMPSRYLRSKAAGEQALWAMPSLDLTVFRPSVVFGPDDAFLNLFAKLQSIFPVMPLARASARFAPVYVYDVASAVVRALQRPASIGQTYELVGPEIFTLGELVKLAGAASGHPRPVIALPDVLGRLQALMMQWAPGPTLMSMDNFDSLSVPNVGGKDALERLQQDLGIEPQRLSVLAPRYLQRKGSALDAARSHARRPD